MLDHPHIIIPGDAALNFTTSEGLTDDAARLTALTHTVRSRLVIAAMSPDASQCRQVLIWMQPDPRIVIRVTTTPNGDTETHTYRINNGEVPHVTAAVPPLTPNPAIFGGPSILPTVIVYVVQQGTTQQTAQLLENYSSYGPLDSAFTQALMAQRWAYTTWVRGERTKRGSFVPTPTLSTFITPVAAYRVKAPLFTPSTEPHILIRPIYDTQLWTLITYFFTLSPKRSLP